MSEVKCNVIEDPRYIPYFLTTNDCDYLILTTPGSKPVAIDRDAIDRMVGTEELETWLKENWTPETAAIAVP